MPIKIKVSAPKEGEKEKRVVYKIDLNSRKTIDGNIMIYSHPEIDIMISPTKLKVVTFPKETLNDYVYNVQKRFFDFLRNKGAITYDSVQGGNVYGSVEASYPEESEYGDPTQYLLLTAYKFMKQDIPNVAYVKSLKDERIDGITDPVESETTELGQIPHAEEKGQLDQKMMNVYRSAPGWRVF